EVLAASEHRVEAPCAYAGTCGGCDWQHVSLSHQRELKSEVVREQLSHLGGITHVNGKPLADFEVISLSPSETGLRWRTRNRYARIGDVSIGMKMTRSHTVVEIDDCLIAVEGSVALAQEKKHLGRGDISTAQSSTGQHVVVDQRGGPWLDETVGDRSWRIHAGSFWQVHKDAPIVFVETVRRFANLKPGDKALDLYAGAGLFAASLAADVTEKGEMVAVESVIDSMRDARRSCSDLPQMDLITADVSKWITQIDEDFEVVILDPPRAGAGLDVVTELNRITKRAIVYVACEPSALGRDAKYLADAGWSMTKLVGLDAFPMTGHVECIALFERY
ncbi:MAG: class I SAM-dependent RNA methyltransferase, partial [Actinobacteria bacterium]|nr:class I SAM-dependent RNA methyltransferase [Actinomycetota bacterium]